MAKPKKKQTSLSCHNHVMLKKTPKNIKIVRLHCVLFVVHFVLSVCVGILRYKVDFQSLQADEPLDDVDLDDY